MSIPSTQKALQLEKPPGEQKKGQRNVAVVREIPVPKPAEGFVLVKILASGFNRRDEWAMQGMYPGLQYKNSTFGCDGAGVVVSGDTPANAKGHPDGLVLLIPTRGWESDLSAPEYDLPHLRNTPNKLGGKGFGLLGNTKPTGGVGTFTEYVAVESNQIVPAPRHLDAVHSAALPCGGVTAYRALFTKGQLRAGQNILITGIGGGVAQLACQFAIAAGAKVFVTGGTKEKVERAIKHGKASGGAVYKDADWPKQIVSQLPKDRPYLDVILDSAGGNISGQALSAGIKPGGKVVCFGMTAEPIIPFTMREVLRNVDVLGSTMGSAQEFKDCIKFVEKHKIVPVIDTVLDGLDNAHKGFPLLADADKRTGGKVIVKVAPSDSRTSKL